MWIISVCLSSTLEVLRGMALKVEMQFGVLDVFVDEYCGRWNLMLMARAPLHKSYSILVLLKSEC